MAALGSWLLLFYPLADPVSSANRSSLPVSPAMAVAVAPAEVAVIGRSPRRGKEKIVQKDPFPFFVISIAMVMAGFTSAQANRQAAQVTGALLRSPLFP